MNFILRHLTWIMVTIPILISGCCNDMGLVPVVIDSDGGADDALGILLFLWKEGDSMGNLWRGTPYGGNEWMKLVAVTSVAGNTGIQNATRNVQTTLEVAGRLDIPVYVGAITSLIGKHNIDEDDLYFGSDGFGDFLPPVKVEYVDNEAAERLVELSKQHEGSLVIICLGPLTNIALAQRKDPKFLQRVKKIHMMGGTVYGFGNMKPGVEFNIYKDPEAADITFRETPHAITVMPFEPVLLNQITKSWRENVFGKLNSTRVKFLNMAERKSLPKSTFWESADPQAVATALWPQLITKSRLTHAVVETGGVYARGAMLIEHAITPTNSVKNARMIEELNVNYYQQILLLAFKD